MNTFEKQAFLEVYSGWALTQLASRAEQLEKEYEFMRSYDSFRIIARLMKEKRITGFCIMGNSVTLERKNKPDVDFILNTMKYSDILDELQKKKGKPPEGSEQV